MTNPTDPLIAAPAEVRAFFVEAPGLRQPGLGIHALDEDESRRYTRAIRETAVGAALGLIALDDANDSNPYCYISNGLASGMILHFSHDPEPQLKFSSLRSFRKALQRAIADGRHIDELECEVLPSYAPQEALVALLLKHAGEPDDVSEFLVCTLLPLLDAQQLPVLERMATHSNFLFRETAARFMRDRLSPLHHSLLEALAAGPFGQVARPASEGLKNLRRLQGRTRRGSGQA